MPIFDYKCKNCGKIIEVIDSFSVPKDLSQVPEKCECGADNSYEKQLSFNGQSFDIVGYCYTNHYGKKAWKRNKSVSDQGKILAGEMDPW